MKCATGRPNQVPTWPQSALPALIEPNRTIANIASPRPRTQDGSATCADTFSVARTAIQESPASTLAIRAVAGSRARANKTSAIAVPSVPPANQPVCSE